MGSSSGLWLYDPEQPDDPVQLAHIEDRAINNVTVNPADMTIAFNVAQESLVYLMNSEGEISTVSADGQAVTDISFSHDGNLIAVASSDIEPDYGFYYDARVQTWNREQKQVATLSSDVTIIVEMDITTDNRNVLIHGRNWGYLGEVIEYWEFKSGARLWNYSDLLRDLEVWTMTDPLLVTTVSSQNYILALGGLHGYHDWDDYLGTAIHIWDANSQIRIHEIIVFSRGLGGDEIYITSMSLNSDGLVLATAQNDGVVRLWSTKDASMIDETNVSIDEIHQLEFSPGDEWLGVVSDESTLVLDVESLEEIASFSPLGVTSQTGR